MVKTLNHESNAGKLQFKLSYTKYSRDYSIR
jgi:hypothetical protein